MTDQLAVHLRPWGDDDLEILVRANSPDMTAHLGGPETDEAVRVRHQRYRVLEGETGQMFVIVAEPGVAVGSVGYWDREWQDGTVYETGWAVLPEHQGRGLAVAGVVRLIEILRAGHAHRWLYAYPKTEHAASNAVARKGGFTLVGLCRFEYPPGHEIECNAWRYDLDST